MRALVTGCAGFIGSHLTERLLTDGHVVTGVDCFNDNYGRGLKLANLARARDWNSFDFVPIDLARGALQDLVGEADVVFHLAAEPGVRASWGDRFETYVRNNLIATQHVLDAVKEAPHARLVYASSSSVYGHAESHPTTEDVLPRPFSPYGVTKLAAEHLCQLYAANHGAKTVSLRFFSVYGPRQRPDMAFTRFCLAALTGERIEIYGDGQQIRDFTYVGDVVEALCLAARAEQALGGVYNVGGGSEIALRDTLDLIRDISGVKLDPSYCPVESGDVRRTGSDITRARRDLGFDPRTDIADGLARQFDWARSTLESRPAAISTPAQSRP